MLLDSGCRSTMARSVASSGFHHDQEFLDGATYAPPPTPPPYNRRGDRRCSCLAPWKKRQNGCNTDHAIRTIPSLTQNFLFSSI